MRWHQASAKWFLVERAGEDLVKAAELKFSKPLGNSAVRAALMSSFDADPRVLGAIRDAPGDYIPVWDNNAGTILPVADVTIPALEDDYPALSSSRA
jgi:hypothetical protein